MKPEIIDANIDTSNDPKEQLISNFYNSVIPITSTVVKFLKTVYGDQDLGDTDLIDSMKNIGKDLVKLNKTIASINQSLAVLEDKTKNPYKLSPGNGFIPINLQLTMDGLSGFKIYQKYTSEQEFLPTNYPESLDFIIKGITHNIENNQWTTVIESLGMPRNPEGSGYISPPTPPLTATSTNTEVAKAPIDINAYNGGDWVTIAFNYISYKEQFLPKARFDATAYRLGYGTDRVIDAKSRKIRKVVPGDTTTRADADTVLRLEIQTTYYNRLVGKGKNQITKGAFDKLSDRQKAALISYVYNVGSLRERIKTSVQTGQYALAAQLIAEGPITSEGKILRGLIQRRQEEAALFSS
jgi:GH24 family phage-related lysozyme (muramidase)